MAFTLFVDESGDQGLQNVRADSQSGGASPFMTLGAFLVGDENRPALTQTLSELRSTFERRNLHCTEMSHFECSKFCREVAQADIRLFSVISKKDTLGEYQRAISGAGQAARYYNKCVQYLLETVGRFMAESGIHADELRIVFEERRGHNYQSTRNFIGAIRRRPLHDNARFLQRIEPFSISALSKTEEPLLEIADLVAYAAYQSVNQSRANFDLPEFRYLREIKPRFWKGEHGYARGFGMHYVGGTSGMNLREDIFRFADSF